SPEEDANAASRAVIDEGKARAAGRQRHPVDLHSGDASRHPARVLDRDLVAGRVVPKRDLEMAPGARNAWIEVEDCPPQAESEQPLDPGSVHPRCGPGIPGPSAAAHVGGLGIDVGGRHIGLHLVSMYPARVLARLIGFKIEKSSLALSPSPSAAKAITAQMAACV